MEQEVIKQEQAVVETPQDNFVIETAEDDIKNAGIDITAQPEKQESKPSDADPVVKEEVKQVEQESKPPKKSRSQRRIERQSQEIKDLKAELGQKQETKPAEVKVEAPEPEDFDDFDDYEEALAKFETNPVVEKETQKPETKADKSESVLQKRIAEINADGAEDYDDYSELMKAEDLIISKPMLEEMLEFDSPSDIAYYLATHKDKSKEMATMSKRQIQKEMIKIEIALESKPQKEVKVTKIPEPINPLNGGTETVRTLKDSKTYKEYESLRKIDQRSNW